MIIAVNTRFLLKDKLEGIGYFTNELLYLLAKQHPEHEFHFFFDRPYDKQFLFAGNVTPHVISPPARHPLLWKYWFDVQVPRLRAANIHANLIQVLKINLTRKSEGITVCFFILELLHRDPVRQTKAHRFWRPISKFSFLRNPG